MTWFERLTGFSETSPDLVRENIRVDGETLTSRVNRTVMTCGRMEAPSLAELRERVRSGVPGGGRMSVRELVGNVMTLHADESNAGSLFQVASQFNLLEMASPDVNPEEGVGIYEHDHTQGPACAISAGAGTIYRNYFAVVNGQIGQTENNQIDCLADVGRVLGNTGSRLWKMQNGYALASSDGLREISQRVRASSEAQNDELRKLLRIGIQWNTQVTLGDSAHLVSQAYCSALPVGYSSCTADLWEDFARIVLEASYEATVCAAILNWRSKGSNRLLLTLVGGGVFGNPTGWIIDSLRRALRRYQDWGIDAAIVSYGRSNPDVRQLVDEFR